MQKIEIFVTNGGKIDHRRLNMSFKNFNILFIIKTTLLALFKTEKSCK